MRITELRFRIKEYFSDPDTYSRDIVHSELGGVTVNQALEMGQKPAISGKRLLRIIQKCPQSFVNVMSCGD